MTRTHKTTTTTAHNRSGARFIPARGGRQARYGPHHRPRDAQPRRRPLPWPRSGDRNLHSWPPGLELPAWGCGSSGSAVPRGKVALQNTRICIHRRGTLITQSTAQIGSFARPPPVPTTLCYLRLSAATAMGLLSVASVAGRPSPGRAALNELSAPALTIHDVTHRGMSVQSAVAYRRYG